MVCCMNDFHLQRLPAPVHAQLAAHLRQAIIQGTYAPGDALPTVSQIVKAHGVSRSTVAKAFMALRVEGLITTSNQGAVVKGGDQAPGLFRAA